MPKVIVEMFPGRTIEQKREMCKQMTDVLVNTINTPREYVNIVIHENPMENNAVNGELFYDMFKK